MMVKLPSSSSSSDSNMLTTKPQTRSKKRLLPKHTSPFEKTYSKTKKESKTKDACPWQLFSETELSSKKWSRRQKKKPAQTRNVSATVTHPTDVIEEEMADLIIEDDIEVMRDVSATTFTSPKRSEKFSKFLQKFNRTSRIRKDFKSPRPVKRKHLPNDHKIIPEFDDLDYDICEDVNSPESTTGVSIQYGKFLKHLQDSPSIPVGLSRKFLNSTAVDGLQNNLLEFTQDFSVITSGSSKQTSEETTPNRLPAQHTVNKRRKKSNNKKEEKKKPVSSTRLFQTNDSETSLPDLSSILHLQTTGKQSIQTEDTGKTRNKRNSSSKECRDEDKGVENPLSPLSLIKTIVNETLVNKQSTFRQDEEIHPDAEFGISSIQEEEDDEDFLQPKCDTRYINSNDFYQTYDIEEVEVPDVICIDVEIDKKISTIDAKLPKIAPSSKLNEDESTIKCNTSNNSVSCEKSTLMETQSKRRSALSKAAQTILKVASPGIGKAVKKKKLSGGSSLIEKSFKTAQDILELDNLISFEDSKKQSKRKTSKLSKAAQTILKVASPGIGNTTNKTISDSSTTITKPSQTSTSSEIGNSTENNLISFISPDSALIERTSKGNSSIPDKSAPKIGNYSKNRSMLKVDNSCDILVHSSKNQTKLKEVDKTSTNADRADEGGCNKKNNTVRSRRLSTSQAVKKEISICCLQTLNFPPPIKVLIRQKTIPNGKRFTTEIKTVSEDILGKAVPPPKGISKNCKNKRSLYYFKDVKRYGRGK